MNAQLKEAPRVGVFADEPAEVYYQRVLGEASNSALKVIDEGSPAHYLHWVEHPEDDESTEALEFGKAFHMAVLEPERFGDEYRVLPHDAPMRPTAAMLKAKKPSPESIARVDWWANWNANNAGKLILTRAAYDLASRMGAALRAYRMDFGGTLIRCGELFDACQKEVTIRWVDEETGLPCKARFDVFEPDLRFGGDAKSVLDASPPVFSRSIHRYRYHVQHAHYCAGANAVGIPLRSFALFPVEKRPPFVPASYHVNAVSEERGWAVRQRSMRKLHRAIASGEFPGYTTTVTAIALPAFAYYDAEE